jgi:formylglycine-generating enzyme required for sulfatase activity
MWPQWRGPNLPIEKVSHLEVDEWCRRNGLRLPSESEWEYACRAGTSTRFSAGDDAKSLQGFANIADAYLMSHYRELWKGAMLPRGTREVNDGFAGTAPVGKFSPNPFGILDLHGNVWEWCADPWEPSYEKAPADGSAAKEGDQTRRVMRGGSWFTVSAMCRTAARAWLAADSRSGDLGFRPALSLR